MTLIKRAEIYGIRQTAKYSSASALGLVQVVSANTSLPPLNVAGYLDSILVVSTNSTQMYLNIFIDASTTTATYQIPVDPGNSTPYSAFLNFDTIPQDCQQISFRLSTAQQSQSDPASSGFSGVDVYVHYRKP